MSLAPQPEARNPELVHDALKHTKDVLDLVYDPAKSLQLRYCIGQLATAVEDHKLAEQVIAGITDIENLGIAYAKKGAISRQEADAVIGMRHAMDSAASFTSMEDYFRKSIVMRVFTHFPDSKILYAKARTIMQADEYLSLEFMLGARRRQFAEDDGVEKFAPHIAEKKGYTTNILLDHYNDCHDPEVLHHAAEALLKHINDMSIYIPDTRSSGFGSFHKSMTEPDSIVKGDSVGSALANAVRIRDELLHSGFILEAEQFMHNVTVAFHSRMQRLKDQQQYVTTLKNTDFYAVLSGVPPKQQEIILASEALRIKHPVQKEEALTKTYQQLARAEHQARLGTPVIGLDDGEQATLEALAYKPQYTAPDMPKKRRWFQFWE